jgi:hypothetical protein
LSARSQKTVGFVMSERVPAIKVLLLPKNTNDGAPVTVRPA